LAALKVSDWFARFTCGNVIPALRVLSAIFTNCGVFHLQIYKSMRLGSILVTKDIPSPNKVANSFSIYPFLSMKPGNDKFSLLSGEGWKDIIDPQRFVASIQ